MNLTTRQRKILQILVDEQREVTLAHIADAVQVSIKTVHRELVHLARSLERDYGLMLNARPGLGLKLIGDTEKLARCREDLHATVPSDTSPEERQRMLCFLLLETDEAMKLSALAEELYSSVPVVRHDLDVLQSWFALQGLQLTLRKGMGLKLEGSETQKREALVLLLWEQFGEGGLLSLLRSEAAASSLCMEEAELLALRIVPLQYIRYAEHILAGLSRDLLPDLAPQDYLQLVLVLAVASVRKRSGFSLPQASQAASDQNLAVDPEVRRIALAAVSGVFSHYSIPVDPEEIRMVERFLRGARPERLGKELLADNLQVLPEINLLIQKCGERLGQNFNADRVLRDGLMAHWVPALYRLQHKLPIKNPLLGRIRQEYGELFAVLQDLLKELFPTLSVPDDEVGYLVLHFGSALSRMERERRRYRALVVCSAGIGSANMLASRLREKIPEIELVANVSWFDIQTMPLEGWDILISTIPLPLPQDRYVLVEPLLSDEGVQKIRSFLNANLMNRSPERQQDTQTGAAALSLDVSRTALSLRNTIQDLIEHISVFSSCNYGSDWENILKNLIDIAARKGFVSDSDAAFEVLLRRSSDHGILLPSSRCLFLHARGSAIIAPFFSVHRLAEPLLTELALWPVAPQTILLMLAPQNVKEGDLSLLNEISVSLLDPDVLARLESGSEQEIRNYYQELLNTDQGGIHHVRNHAD
ncbi:MAG: PRD domain-containing protein [Treponema sp.]|nr:PRD domain-containing protein [Treponema sp.]